jgi:hypothetical protein
LALQALLTPGVATVTLALLFYVLGGAGLAGALIAATALAVAAAAPAAAPASLRPARLALLAASGPLAAAAAFAIHGSTVRNARNHLSALAHISCATDLVLSFTKLQLFLRTQGTLLSAGDAFATLWLLDVLRAALSAAAPGARALARLAAADARLAASLRPGRAPLPQPALLAGVPSALRAALARPGALIMLAGPPAAGKSALCRAAAAYATVAAGKRRFAFAGSTPFLLAGASLRDNILFGAPYDAVRYAAACDATLLRRLVFPHFPAGDLSRPRDVAALPRGGAQLISLARAVYAAPAAAALDVRLSELEPLAAAAVFRAAIGPGGALAAATRVLVLDAGSMHLLAEADCGVLLGGGGADASAGGGARGGRIAVAGPHAVLRAHPQLAAIFAGGGTARRRDALEAGTAAAVAAGGCGGGFGAAGANIIVGSGELRRGARRSESWCAGASAAVAAAAAAACTPAAEPLHTARSAAPASDEASDAITVVGAAKSQQRRQLGACAVYGVAAMVLLLCAHLALGGATWQLVRHLDTRTEGLTAALGFMVWVTVIGGATLAAGIAAATRAIAAGAHACEPAPACEAAAERCAAAATALLAGAAGAASAALLAAIAPHSLAATLPAAAAALLAAMMRRRAAAAVAAQAVAASRGIDTLMRDLEPPGAAVTVAAYGASPRFCAELARLLDGHNGAEWWLARAAAAAGAAVDVTAVAALAAALTAPGPRQQGAAAVGWAVLQARWAGAALRAAAALAQAAPPSLHDASAHWE